MWPREEDAMNDTYDVIIIGACTAYELSRKGRRTLNIDKMAAAGAGSTGNSCAIIRTHYSTYDGTAMAYEGFFYWRDWADYIGVEDERGLARYVNTDCIVLKTELNGNLQTICDNQDALGIPWENLDAAQLGERLPIYDVSEFGPVKTLADPAFGEASGRQVPGAVFFPNAGYVSDPQLATHNVQRAAEAEGATFRFNSEITAIRRSGAAPPASPWPMARKSMRR